MAEHNGQLTTDHAADPAPAGRTYWQSFEHLADSPEVQEAIDKEFSHYDPDTIRSLSRRKFLKYAVASMALAGIGLAGCRRWPREVIAPYAHDDGSADPGVPEYFATSWELAGVGVGLLAQSWDGRPIKLEGNPSHPGSRVRSGEWGSADAFAQAQILTLYDPDRSRSVLDQSGATPVRKDGAWFAETVLPRLRRALSGGRLAVLATATASPTVLRLRQNLEAAGGKWFAWEPFSTDETSAATQAAFGRDLRPVYHLDKALVVVSLDDDYLGHHPAHTRYAADWSKMRVEQVDLPDARMSRCYTVETKFSLTGAGGDIRLPARPERVAAVAMGIARGVGVAGIEAVELTEREQAFVDAAVADLQAHAGESLVCFGSHLPADVQRLAMAINARLNNVGETLSYIENPAPAAGTLAELVSNPGDFDAVVVLGGNPVYDGPADLDVGRFLESVPTSVHLSLYVDETSRRCDAHVPQAHFLEHWGDTRGWDGTVSAIQPLILPLFGGLSQAQMLETLLGREPGDGYATVATTFSQLTGEAVDNAAFDDAFRKYLHDGVLPDSAAEPVTPGQPALTGLSIDATPADGFVLHFSPDASVHDGRFANNGWLQELPDPLTKLTWDNAALVNVVDARELGIKTNDMLRIEHDGRTLDIAVYVMPGQPRGVIGLPVGYGRTSGGTLAASVGREETGGGFDTYRLRTLGRLGFATGATVVPVGQKYVLAMTQNHHLIDATGYKGREKRTGSKNESAYVVRESGFEEHREFLAGYRPKFESPSDRHNTHPAHKGKHGGVTLQLFQPPGEFNYPHAWGMSIDMTACTGCSACVVACQAENNIPVVGKESVLNNREMHWLRVDRYFKADGEDVDEKKADPNPDVAWQPMMCVHCENAPCEQVCPVAATVHDTEGLNTMVYNRCIGTRYCSNNCPYKVRRFNYLDYHYKGPLGSTLDAAYLGIPDQQQLELDPLRRMTFNPEVSVRMRGVMEKCTYCTQRIQKKTIWRRNNEQTVQDGDIRTACQQACPTEAIVFGNLNDTDARVTRDHARPRTYGVLAELNTRPRTKYLAKLRNRPSDLAHEGDH
jgi:molybdopterin-containing oxidoreductase family iron-sulfur binding subunit